MNEWEQKCVFNSHTNYEHELSRRYQEAKRWSSQRDYIGFSQCFVGWIEKNGEIFVTREKFCLWLYSKKLLRLLLWNDCHSHEDANKHVLVVFVTGTWS